MEKSKIKKLKRGLLIFICAVLVFGLFVTVVNFLFFKKLIKQGNE